MSVWRLCQPVLNAWTHFKQIFYITNCYHLETLCTWTKLVWQPVELLTTQRTRVPLKSKVTTSIAWVSIIMPNRSSTFKQIWANSLARCYAYWLYALLLRPQPLICNILWRHKTPIKSVCEDTQQINCWSNILIINRVGQIWISFSSSQAFWY